jgi:hypothetical protein
MAFEYPPVHLAYAKAYATRAIKSTDPVSVRRNIVIPLRLALKGYLRRAAGVAALPWNQWQHSHGMGGRLHLESWDHLGTILTPSDAR